MHQCNNIFSKALVISDLNSEIPDLSSTTANEVIKKLNATRNHKKSITLPESITISDDFAKTKLRALWFLKQGMWWVWSVSRIIDTIIFYFWILKDEDLIEIIRNEDKFKELLTLPRVGTITISCLMLAIIQMRWWNVNSIPNMPIDATWKIHMSSVKPKQMHEIRKFLLGNFCTN